MSWRYDPEPEPFLSDIMLGARMQAVVMEAAYRIQGKAKAIAPVDEGDYVASIVSYPTRTLFFQHGPRVVGIVEAGHGLTAKGLPEGYATLVEWRHGTMMKAMGR